MFRANGIIKDCTVDVGLLTNVVIHVHFDKLCMVEKQQSVVHFSNRSKITLFQSPQYDVN